MTENQPPRAFVVGATGYTGKEVVRVLREKGIETIAHVRPDSTRLAHWREHFGALGVRVDQTPWDPDAMTAMLAKLKPTLVFALLGTTRARKNTIRHTGGDPNTATYMAVDYGLTALLIKAAVDAGLKARFVYLSAVGVGPNAKSEYYGARVRAEAKLITSGLPFVIARPTIITGPDREEDRRGERLGAVVIDGLLGAAGAIGFKAIDQRYRSLSGPQLGCALVTLALDPAAENQVYETGALRAKAAE